MTYVDERIVELQFDNKQFEKETAHTMSTLDKLKEKLSFNNASSGAEQLQKAVASINVNPIIQGIDTIETKMSMLSIAGKRIVENVVDWAMSGVQKLINKLNVVNQIITGGKTRALNIEQAKFQLEGLGVAWEDIQEDINYGVQDTAYGLDAAAKVAAQLVASQVELGDEMKHSLLGISGVAAMTNSTYEDIGRIYTTVAGNGRLMGEQLLQLSSRGINAAATLAKSLNTTEAEVRDMVSKGKISFEMFSDAMFEAFGEHAKSANKTFQGALSNTKAALSRLGADVAAQGFNSIRDILNDVIPKLKEFKKRMKPVEDSIIRMTDAIGKLVQSFIKSIDIEGIVNRIAPKIKKVTDAIGDYAKAYTMVFEDRKIKNFTAYIEEQKALDAIKTSADGAKESLVDFSKITEEEVQMANDVWYKGAYGTGEERKKQLGEHYEMVQAYIEKMIELGWDQDKMQEELTKSTEEQTKAEEDLARASKKKTTINNLFKIFDNLKRIANNIFTSIKNVISVMFDSFSDAFEGKSLLESLISFTGYLADISDKLVISKDRAEKLRPVFDMLGDVLKFIGKAIFTIVRGTITAIDKISKLYSKIKHDERFIKIADNIKTAFITVYETIVKVFNKLKEKGVIDSLLNGLGYIFEFISNVLVTGVGGLSTVFSSLVDGIGYGVSGLIDIFSSLFTSVIDGTKGPLTSFVDLIKDLLDKISIRDILHLGGLVAFAKLIYTFYSIISSAIGMIRGVSNIGASIVGFFESLKDLAEAKVRRYNIETIVMFVDSMVKIIWAIIALTAIMTLVPNADKMAWQAFGIVAIITALYGAINIITTKISSEENSKSIGNVTVTLNSQRLQMGVLLSGIALMVTSIVKALKDIYGIVTDKDYNRDALIKSILLVIGTIGTVVGVTTLLVYSLNKMDKAKNVNKVSFLILAFALSFKTIIKGLSTIYETTKSDTNMNRFVAITGIVAGLYSLVIVLLYTLSKLKKIKNMTSLSLLLLSYALSIKMVINSVKDLIDASNTMGKPEHFVKSVNGVIKVIGVIGLVLIALTGINALSEGKKKPSSLLGISTVILSFAVLLKALSPILNSVTSLYKEYGGEKVENAIWGLIKIVGIFGLLTIAIQALSTKTGASSILSLAGVSLVVLSLSHAIRVLTDGIVAMSSIDTSKIKTIAIAIGGVLGVLLLLAGVIAKLMGPIGILGLVSISALIISFGLTLFLAGKGMREFTDSIINFVDQLPNFVYKFLAFFQTIADNRDELLDGIVNTISLSFDVLLAEFLIGFAKIRENVPTFIDSLLDTVAATLNGLAVSLAKRGPEVVDAIENLAGAFGSVIGYAFAKGADLAEGFASGVMDGFIKGLPGGRTVGKATWYEDMANSVIEEATGEIPQTYAELRESYEKKIQSEQSKYPIEIDGSDSVDYKFDYKKVIGDIFSKYDSDELLETAKSKMPELNIDSLLKSYETGDTEDMSEYLGYSIGDAQIEAYVNALADGSPEAIDAISDMQFDVDDMMLDQTNDFTEYGELNFENYSEGVKSKKELVLDASKEIQDAAIEKMKSYRPEFYKAAEYNIAGYNEGLTSTTSIGNVISNISDIVETSINTMCKVAKISSPSKVFAELGGYVTMGFANGILELSKYSEKATEDVGNNAINSLKSIISRIYDKTLGNLDTNPVISPIIDMSQVEDGFSTINGMFGGGAFGLALGAGSGFNAMLAARNAYPIQNEFDDSRTVDAINSLRSEISDMREAIMGMGVYLDSRTLVGQIAEPMSNEMNRINVKVGRGVK